MKPADDGIAHLIASTKYSLQGLKAAYKGEAAFRQECFVIALLFPSLLILPLDISQKMLMAASLILILVVELLNSAIEAVVDLVSPEFHPLAGKAKDMGSAAVMGSLLIAGIVWSVSLWQVFSAS